MQPNRILVQRQLHIVALAALIVALPVVASAQNNLNFDTGQAVSSGGDISWASSTGVSPVGSAKLSDFGALAGATIYGVLNGTFLLNPTQVGGAAYASTPIGPSALVKNDAFAVKTNGGNYAKVLVTAASSSSVTLQFVTYSGTAPYPQTQNGTVSLGGPGAPQITLVQNNYSYILPAAPNYGISPGSLIIIKGSSLAAPGSQAVLQDPSKALPTNLNGSTASITIGGTTVNAAYYYALPTQLGIVIPSTTPVGTGTITASYGGQNATAPITIVGHSFGFDTWPAAPSAGVTDNMVPSPRPGHLITASYAAKQGETITFWGTGDGANTKNTDVSPPTDFTQVNGITTFYIGGTAVTPVYQGRSGYQGLDQINVTIPANAPTGCAISVVAVSGTGANAIVSNTVTIPIISSSSTIGPCVDPLSQVDPTQLSNLFSKGTVKFGGVAVSQSTASGKTTDEAIASFYSISGASLTSYESGNQPSLGSCTILQENATTITNPFTLTGLDAGTVKVTPPGGSAQTMQTIAQVPGAYFYQIPTPAPLGSYMFTGSGGADVGAFSNVAVNFSSPLVWSNSGSVGTVTRTAGVTVTWTGGSPGTYAQISGDAVSTAGFSGQFICNAPVSAGTFTVPSAVLLALPAGTGSLSVSNYANPTAVSIPNLDFAYATSYASTSITATYQ